VSAYNPYLDVVLWPTPDAAAIAKEAGLKAMTLAFLVEDPERTGLCWGGQPTYPVDWMQSQTKALAKAGVTFDVSIGGATGQDIAASLEAQVAADAYAKAWRELRPRFLDFDIEGAAVMDVLQHQVRLEALAIANEQVVAEGLPKIRYTMTLAVMPEGLPAAALDLLEMAQKSKRGCPDEVRIMAMDYGSSYVDMGVSAIQAAEAASKQLQEAVIVVPMIGQNDIMEEVFSLDDAQMLASYAAAHPQVVSGLSAWSLGRDRPCEKANLCKDDITASPSCSGVQQAPYEFSGILSEND